MKNAQYVQIVVLSLIALGSFSFIVTTLTANPRSQVAAVVDTSGLIAYWSFDEGTGSTAADSVGGNTGTLVNGPTWVAGKSGTALSFDGANDIVTLGSDILGTGPLSISIWLYPRSFGQITAGVVDNGKTALRYTGSYRMDFCSDGVTCKNSGNNTVLFNQWTHVVVTRDASGITNYYINGSPAGTPNQNSGTPIAGNPVKIGNLQNGFHTFDGIIDELKIYDRVIDASEAAALYAAGNSGTPSDPPSGSGPTAVNGMCSATLNSCSAGTFSDQTDTSTNALWQCVGSNGGTTASCSLPITQTPATVTPVNGVYTVNINGGTNTFTTIQACADVVKAGETCEVYSGTYDEKVIPKNSGIPGNPIIFKANGSVKMRGFHLENNSAIQVNGFEITNLGLTQDGYAAVSLESSNYMQIYNNTIHDTVADCIRLRDQVPANISSNNHIKGNTISHCGALRTSPGIGITVFGNNNLVENNDISHIGEDFTRVTGGDYNIIRNNVFHDNSYADFPTSLAHIDGMQNWCSTAVPVPTRYLLIENNQLYNAPSSDTHFVIFQNYALCDEHNFIVRYNSVRSLGDYVLINNKNTKGIMLYNNTFSDTSIASIKPWNSVDWTNSSTNGKLFNNIFINTVKDGGFVYSVDATSQPFEAHNNFAYNPGTTNLFGSPIKTEVGAILGKDPLFTSSTNFILQSTSPAIDKGGYLTKVSATDGGSGTTLVVDDASVFQDGWNGVQKDWIAVGSPTNVAQISSINYSTNTITLNSSISRSPGSPVYLYKDSSGRQVLYGNAPDMGAYESTYTGTPTPTQTLVGDFDNSGTVNSADWSYMNSKWGTNDPTADLNHDGKVNTLDFGILVKNWTN